MKSTHKKEYQALLSLLVRARKDAGLTQAELARKLKVHQSFISKYEQGERRMDIFELIEITQLLGINYKKLLDQIIKP